MSDSIIMSNEIYFSNIGSDEEKKKMSRISEVASAY
jgi:hypothetical protein